MKTIYFEEQCQDVRDLFVYLNLADHCFYPFLSKQVDMAKYIEKVAQHAHLIWCICEGKRVGLCAFYANQPPKAFLTSLSVLTEYQGRGLASSMLEYMISWCEKKGCSTISLEVYKTNVRAQKLYRSKGFCVLAESKEKYIMTRKLGVYDGLKEI